MSNSSAYNPPWSENPGIPGLAGLGSIFTEPGQVPEILPMPPYQGQPGQTYTQPGSPVLPGLKCGEFCKFLIALVIMVAIASVMPGNSGEWLMGVILVGYMAFWASGVSLDVNNLTSFLFGGK